MRKNIILLSAPGVHVGLVDPHIRSLHSSARVLNEKFNLGNLIVIYASDKISVSAKNALVKVLKAEKGGRFEYSVLISRDLDKFIQIIDNTDPDKDVLIVGRFDRGFVERFYCRIFKSDTGFPKDFIGFEPGYLVVFNLVNKSSLVVPECTAY